jgi:hypothetical protein
VQQTIHDKRHKLHKNGAILMQDNAAPHLKKVVLGSISKFGWVIMAHSAYSPDLWTPV